ncbi:MAG: phosphoribosylformylglycinamidine synthase subunit PurQ [Bdellovibrionaceae bacterium]|jgi:phosphoribosylformylglycinamidine synthase subunit PurQ / glutaminase|nr:phosphoribosylformylglycinamidine synthase subunit PurQ [Pseudobdellovibrionaceae bacterium]
MIGVVRFLGTNCDQDIWKAVESSGKTPSWLWYQDQFNYKDYESIIIPGGFSYGDYVRTGALAAKTPVMDSVREAAKYGVPIMGICNGFQILCESGLLPGVLVKNNNLRFIDKWVELKGENSCESWGGKMQSCNLPIAHGEGCFFTHEEELKQIEDQQQVWLRYKENPNGSLNDIAGVMNKEKNVAGLMPHPERALFDWMGGSDGAKFF